MLLTKAFLDVSDPGKSGCLDHQGGFKDVVFHAQRVFNIKPT